MNDKRTALSKLLKLTMFGRIPNLSLSEIGMEQIFMIVRASVSPKTYAEKEPSERIFFYTFICTRQYSITVIKEGIVLQVVLNSASESSIATLDSSVPSVLEVHMFFHSIATVGEINQVKALKFSRSYPTRILNGHTVQKISNA